RRRRPGRHSHGAGPDVSPKALATERTSRPTVSLAALYAHGYRLVEGSVNRPFRGVGRAQCTIVERGGRAGSDPICYGGRVPDVRRPVRPTGANHTDGLRPHLSLAVRAVGPEDADRTAPGHAVDPACAAAVLRSQDEVPQ